jgi:hypothetical protein
VHFFTTSYTFLQPVHSGGTKRSELYGRSRAARRRVGDVVADVFSSETGLGVVFPTVPLPTNAP